MLQRIAFLGVTCFLLSAAGSGFCQRTAASPESDCVKIDPANEIPIQDRSASGSRSLPDAPSASLPNRRTELPGMRVPARPALKVGAVALYPGSMRKTDASYLAVGPPPGALAFDGRADERSPEQKEPSFILSRYLYRSTLPQDLSRRGSTRDSMMGRATDAASGVLIPRNASGKRKLNTPYLTRVLATVVVHAAGRPYWERTRSEPFSDFASTVGNDTGMNVLHEFEPGIKQILASHTPRFVSGIEERLLHSAPSHR